MVKRKIYLLGRGAWWVALVFGNLNLVVRKQSKHMVNNN